jgi:hypothetical protein
MRILCSIVESFVLAMLYAGQDLAFRCSITLQFISDDDAWDILQLLEQFAEEAFRRFFVPPALHQDIEHVAVLINCPSEIVGFAVDFQVPLIHMPCVSAARTTTTQFVGIYLPKCEAPLPDCFIGEDNSTLCHQFFDIVETE